MELPNHVLLTPISIASILENVINFTTLYNTAVFLLERYREFYRYCETVEDEVGNPRVDVEIDVERIYKSGNEEMLKFVFENADVLMKPYTLVLRRGTRVATARRVQKTPAENQKIIDRLESEKMSDRLDSEAVKLITGAQTKKKGIVSHLISKIYKKR